MEQKNLMKDTGEGRIDVAFTRDIRIKWDWNDLLEDAVTAEENLNLTVAGLVLSRNAEISGRTLEKTMRQLGFDRIVSDNYRLSTETKNAVSKPARTFGYKAIEKDGKTYNVVCAVFKGTTTIPDALTDIKSIKDGFLGGGQSCAASLREYISGIDGADIDNTILFITGHSLGAATANVVGRLSRELAHKNASFVYTFASPNYETEGEFNDGKKYPNFRYFTNEDDIVPDVPLRIRPHCFAKIGVEHLFNYHALESEQKQKFNRVYRYFRGMSFEEDTDLLGLEIKKTESLGFKALKNHLAHTYMSFIFSELTDAEIEMYLGAGRISIL